MLHMPDFKNRDSDAVSGSGEYKRFLVIYDGACGICIASVGFLHRIDYLKRYSYMTLQEYSRQTGSKIPVEMLQESIHVIDGKNGRTLPGMEGISILLLNSPPAFPIYLLVRLMRLLSIADPMYAWISASRYFLSRYLVKH